MIGSDPNPSFAFRLAAHRGRTRIDSLDLAADPGTAVTADFAGAQWTLLTEVTDLDSGGRRLRFEARITRGRAEGVSAGLVLPLAPWSMENYVLIPGAVYAGNRFDALRRPYSPAIRDIGQRGDLLKLDIGDIPRLSLGTGRSHLDQTSLDASVPAVGIRFADRATGWLLLTPRTSAGQAIGLEIIENGARDAAELILLCPGFLHPLAGEADSPPAIGDLAGAHKHPENPRPTDLETGDAIGFEVEWHEFPCPDVPALFAEVFARRTTMFPEANRESPDILPFSAAWDLLEAKHNAQNWNGAAGLYQVGLPWLAKKDSDQASQFWQNGWCGGGIASFALGCSGTAASRECAERNVSFLLREGLAPSGLFKAVMAPNGEWQGDGGNTSGFGSPLSLTRRQGDSLLFVLRHLHHLGPQAPAEWQQASRRCANALCDFWDREGEFGFLIDYENASVAVRGSTSGALIPAALALASQIFEEPRFLETALAAAAHYRDHGLAWGVTTGGPGDAVQAPDGESIFALIESFIALYEITGQPEWREAAVRACHQAASWVISFPLEFPPGSALGQLSIDARGTMIANAQNKCGVPGICTLSGEGIFRTFRATGDTTLLDLLREIAHALPQFVSRDDRPIPARITWGHPMSELPTGWICERVNLTPSWPEPLGEQAAYSCWCEVAMMLTWCDLPGVYAQPDTGLIRRLDHVRADWSVGKRTALRLTNSTPFPARVRVMTETRADSVLPLGPNFALSLPVVEIPAGGQTVFPL